MQTVTLDMLGKPCPIPVIEAKKAIAAATAGDIVAVIVDNDIARQNLEKMAKGMGHAISHRQEDDGNIVATITVSDGCRPVADDAGGLVVAIGRSAMGDGDDELGGNLMKSFIYSLTEFPTPPEHIIFYNGGARLTCTGSATLDDLKNLEARGTTINTCGTCLNFYTIADTLQIGGVTNMFTIAETMASAKRLINL